MSDCAKTKLNRRRSAGRWIAIGIVLGVASNLGQTPVSADDFRFDASSLASQHHSPRVPFSDQLARYILQPPTPPATESTAADQAPPAVRTPQQAAPQDTAPQQPVPLPPPPPPPQALARGFEPQVFGVTMASGSAAPNMIGDSLFYDFIVIGPGLPTTSTVSLSGGDRRFKVADNTSPIPKDRVFFNYNHFHNAATDITEQQQSIDRYTLGFEKTFFDRQASIEIRLPMIDGLNSTQVIGSSDSLGGEVGDLGLALKVNLISRRDWMIAAGMTMTLPTADDYVAEDASGIPLIQIDNEAVHMAPYLGFFAMPNRCWFAQGFVQADFDLNGHDVYEDVDRTWIGTIQEQNLLYVDASVGRWLHRGGHFCPRLCDIAAIAELHYTSTLNDSDSVGPISNPANRMDILNATGALVFQFPKATLRVGVAAPLKSGDQRFYDTEGLIQFNRYF